MTEPGEAGTRLEGSEPAGSPGFIGSRAGFRYETRASQVIFAPGQARERVREEVERLAVRRVLVVPTPGRAELAGRLVAWLEAGGSEGRPTATAVHLFPRAAQHVPSNLAATASALARELDAELCIAVGGGSAVGLAKAVALETRIPILAVPTTFAGSEMTAVWGITDREGKRTGRDQVVAPRTVIYDSELARQLPSRTAVASAFNAMAHAIGALYAPDANPVTDLMAEEAIRLLARALPGVAGVERAGAPFGVPVDPCFDALLGAHLAGRVLDATSMGLQHRLSHMLGGTFDLPHAEVHASLLPYVVAHLEGGKALEGGSISAGTRLRRALGTDGPPSRALLRLQSELGFAPTLADLGLAREDVERAARRYAKEAARRGRTPKAGDAPAVRAVLEAAFEGAGRVPSNPGSP